MTQGLAQLAMYLGFVLPRLEARGLSPWIAVSLPAFFLGLQHGALPLLFDIRSVVWRDLMYLPFAFLIGIVLHWRPRLVP